MSEIVKLPLEKIKRLEKAYLGCYSNYRTYYSICKDELNVDVHHSYKKYLENYKDYFYCKEGGQKGDVLWKAKIDPIITIVERDFSLNKSEIESLDKILDDDNFRKLVRVQSGFNSIYDILGTISVICTILYVTKLYHDYKGLKIPEKGKRRKIFVRQLERKSKNLFLKMFPETKELDQIIERKNLDLALNLFNKLSIDHLRKLMYLSKYNILLPYIIGSSYTTIDAFYSLTGQKR